MTKNDLFECSNEKKREVKWKEVSYRGELPRSVNVFPDVTLLNHGPLLKSKQLPVHFHINCHCFYDIYSSIVFSFIFTF